MDLTDKYPVPALVKLTQRFEERFVAPAVAALEAELRRQGIPFDRVIKPERPEGLLVSRVEPAGNLPWVRIVVAYCPGIIGDEWEGRVDVMYEKR